MIASGSINPLIYITSVDNILDLSRITTMILYIITSNKEDKFKIPGDSDSVVFGWLILFSGLGFLKFIKMFTKLRLFMIMV